MLTIDDLKEMGILSYGHRMDLFVSIAFSELRCVSFLELIVYRNFSDDTHPIC